MKNLFFLAIAVNLVSVQESRIIQEDFDYENFIDFGRDYSSFDGSDAILAEQNLAELQDMKTLEGSRLEKRGKHINCEENTCKTCGFGLCLGITHLPTDNKLKVHIDWRNKVLYDKIIEPKPWSKCKRVGAFGFGTTACLTLSNVTIENSKVCTNLSFGVTLGTKTFEHVCV